MLSGPFLSSAGPRNPRKNSCNVSKNSKNLRGSFGLITPTIQTSVIAGVMSQMIPASLSCPPTSFFHSHCTIGVVLRVLHVNGYQDFNDEEIRNTQSPYVAPHMFAIRSSHLTMEQILRSLAEGDHELREREPHFTYASTAGTADVMFNNAKVVDEVLVDLYSSLYGIYSNGVRLLTSTIYGPWGRDGSPIHDLSKAAISHHRRNNCSTAITIKLQATYKEDKKTMICNLAFVPEDSRLVNVVIRKVPDSQLGQFGTKRVSGTCFL
jgi:hypothetical protein